MYVDEILQKRTLEPRTQYAEEDELRFQQQLLLQQNPGLLPTIRTPRERPDPYLYTPPQPSGAGGASASDAPAAPVSSAMVPRITTPRKSITPLGTPRGGSTGGGGSYSQLTAQNVQQLNALTPGDTGTVAGGMPQLNLQGTDRQPAIGGRALVRQHPAATSATTGFAAPERGDRVTKTQLASPYHQPAESVPAANDPYNAVLAPAPQMNPGSYGNGYGYATATSSGYGTSWDGGSNQSAYHAPYPDPTPAAQQQHYSQQQHAHPTYAYPGNYQQPAPVYPQPQVPYLHDPADPAGPPAAYPPFDRTQANNDRHGSISSSAPSIQRPKRIPLSQVAMSATQQRTGIYPTPQQLAEQRYAEMNPESLPPQRPLFVEQGLLPSPRNFSAPPPGRGAHFQQQHFPPPPMGLGGGVMGGLPAPQPGGLVPSQGVRPIYNQSRQQAAAPTRSVDDSFRYDTNLSAAAMAGLFTSPGPLAASGRDGGGGGNHSFGAQHEEMMNGLEEMIRHGRSATERDFSPEERDKVKKWVRKAQELKGQVVEALAESWSSWNNGGGRRMYVDHRGGPSPGDGFRYGLPGSGDNDEGGLSEEKSALRVKIESSLEYLFSKFLGRSSERTSFDGGGAPGMPGDFYSNGGGAAPPGPGSYVGGDGGFP
eukprot:g6029.t1